MSDTGRILVVDDERQILHALTTILRGAGYDVDVASTGAEALAAATIRPPDAIVLDLVLPDMHGTEVTRRLRQQAGDVPIVILSAVGEERQKVEALDAGADDYVTKPFGMEELLARLRAVLRRVVPPGEPVQRIGELEIDVAQHRVTFAGKLITLTPTEFSLLRLFAENEGKLLTHRTILKRVWGPAYQVEAHYLHVYISRLRQKIEPNPTRPRYLVTETGAGYRLVNPDDQ